MNDLDFLNLDFTEQVNHAIRVPVVILADVSGSMKPLMADLNLALNDFLQSLKADLVASKSAELAIVTFDHEVNTILNFETVNNIQSIPQLTSRGATFTGQALLSGLNLCQQRKQYYQSEGYDYYQPWLVIMTDGQPSATDSQWLYQANLSVHDQLIKQELMAMNKSCQELHQLINDKKLNLINIAIGNEADLNYLKSLHPDNRAFKMTADTNFAKFFSWLGKSVKAKSNSQKGDAVKTAPLAEAGLDIC
jgi:uncharacterized protein YegL